LTDNQGDICRGRHVLVTEFRGVALNVLFCADVLRPLDLAPPLTDFTYKYQLAHNALMLLKLRARTAPLTCSSRSTRSAWTSGISGVSSITSVHTAEYVTCFHSLISQ